MALAVLCLAACASEKLEQGPPPGVDFTGRWKLNEADSDDPQRLAQAQFNQGAAGQSNPASEGRGRRGGGPMPAGGPGGPMMPSAGALGAGLRWPGKQLEIKQVAGVVAFISGGASRVCQPMDAAGKTHRRPAAANHRDAPASPRDAPLRSREAPPPRCGWADKTLIVQDGDPDDDRPLFEEHYSLSEDRQRLVEVVGFKGGRSNGYTLSRVWDRQPQ